jgi:hypothetical protein
MKTQPTLAQSEKSVSPAFSLKRLTMRVNPHFATSRNQLRIQKLYNQLNWLTVLRSARVAGLNA